jgi:hypothetical protein
VKPTSNRSRASAAATLRSRLLYGSCTVLAALACSRPCHAYLDPGTGSIILQSLLASIAVALGVLRVYWQRCKAFVLSLKRPASNADNNRPAEPSDSD